MDHHRKEGGMCRSDLWGIRGKEAAFIVTRRPLSLSYRGVGEGEEGEEREGNGRRSGNGKTHKDALIPGHKHLERGMQ